jgi:hypothetical protein
MKNCLSLLLPAIIVAFSCSSSHKAEDAKEDKRFNAWLHHSKSELVKKWGEPDSIFTDGKGGEILLYKEALDYKSVMDERYTGLQFSFKKEMFINRDSLIYNWRAWRRK